MHYIYILRCADDTLYTGYTTDVNRRLNEHNTGVGAKYTKFRGPCTLVYTESYDTRVEATKREYAIKQLKRQEKEYLINSISLAIDDSLSNNEIRRYYNVKKDLKFYICNHCKNVIIKLTDSNVPVVCCGENMVELVPNTTEAATEKHIPVVERLDNNEIQVSVGSTLHPMEEAHYIQWVVLVSENGYRVHHFKPGDTPVVKFLEDEKIYEVYEYCNLHGLWKVSI